MDNLKVIPKEGTRTCKQASKKIILYIIIGILILGLLLLTIFPGIIYAIKDTGNSGTDKCTPEPGYTEQEWIEHMGHHPEIYKECLT